VKSYIYTLEDEYLGIPIIIEGELVDYEDGEMPFVVIQELSYGEKLLEMWCISEAFIKHCQNRIFQEWCNEARSKEQKESITSNRSKGKSYA